MSSEHCDSDLEIRMAGQKKFRKILLFVTEDGFVLSHFKPLIILLAEITEDLVVVVRTSGKQGEIEAFGARVIDFDFRRSSRNPLRELASAMQLAKLLRAERPDILHLTAMKPMVLGSLASRIARVRGVILHTTGLGHLAISQSRATRVLRGLAMRLIAARTSSGHTWLLVENPDDSCWLHSYGIGQEQRTTILGGAGIDPDAFPACRQPVNNPPIVACVGRMIRSKGLDVLVQAYDILKSQGVSVSIALYGGLDDGNPECLSMDDITEMTDRADISWYGQVHDVRAVWETADIAVIPSVSREGLPRALLEAAASARPLVVTDVPGCRHFVRHEIEGLIVPPGDAVKLADAIKRLISDSALRLRLGRAARMRVLQGGFTEADVISDLRRVYSKLAAELFV